MYLFCSAAIQFLFFCFCFILPLQNHYITPEEFGHILYENFLFDIPKLMDLCVLYGAGNGPLLSKMIQNVFTQQPQFMEDMRAVVPTVLQVQLPELP